jgi:predicted RNA-binding protein with PIN domain
MPYLIDGHNLIARLDDITLDDPQDEMKLVNQLRSFAARTQKRCVVVFDRGLPGGKSPMSTSTVEVVFASATQSNADDVLMRRIQKTQDPRGWTIVTSDERVLGCGISRNMRGMRSHEFAKILKVPANKPDLGEWAHVYVKPEEVAEFLLIFSQQPAPPAPIVSPHKPSTPSITPKTPPDAPTVPLTVPKSRKPKTTQTQPDDDEKNRYDDDLDYWLNIFGE